MIQIKLDKKFLFILISVIFLIIFTLIYGLLQYQYSFKLHPDEISYLEIAQFYKNGDFYKAINAYWSPAFSWLLIPFSYITNWPFAANLVNVLLIPIFFISTYIMALNILKQHVKALFVAILSLLLPYEFLYGWLYITPDILLTIYCVWYLYIFLKILNYENPNLWFIFGIISGIGYLLKTIFLPISVLFLFAVFVLLKIENKKNNHPTFKLNLKSLLLAYFGCLIICSAWSYQLFLKYGQFTLGTSSNINYQEYVINLNAFEFLKKPIKYPLNGTSYWYDPSQFSKIHLDFNKQILAIKKNLFSLLGIIVRNFTLSCFLVIFSYPKIKKNLKAQILLLFIIIWCLGYIPILVVPRYLFPIIPIWFVLALLSFRKQYLFIWGSYLLILLIMFARGYTRSYIYNPIFKTDWQISQVLPVNCVLLSDNWIHGMAVAYLSHCKFYGVTTTSSSKNENIDETLKEETNQGKVNFFLSYDSNKYNNLLLLTVRQVWSNDQQITLYAVN